jgi:hypothetical protein
MDPELRVAPGPNAAGVRVDTGCHATEINRMQPAADQLARMINFETAKVLGRTIAQAMPPRADEVIQRCDDVH